MDGKLNAQSKQSSSYYGYQAVYDLSKMDPGNFRSEEISEP